MNFEIKVFSLNIRISSIGIQKIWMAKLLHEKYKKIKVTALFQVYFCQSLYYNKIFYFFFLENRVKLKTVNLFQIIFKT